MLIFKKPGDVSRHLMRQKKRGLSIGFVPTMGALHKGHFSLIEKAKTENDLTVCSLFVNPSQFNNPDDLKHYPVTLEKDIEGLTGSGCDVLFIPVVADMYPQNFEKKGYALGPLESVFEGEHRPGHFQGVCQAVHRLIDIVNPDRLYMGQKDYQQTLVIAKLLKLTQRTDVQLTIVPTVREADGLAMSSRNLRLSEAQRKKAPALFQTLTGIKQNKQKEPLHELTKAAAAHLENNGFRVDYVAIAEAETLAPATNTDKPLVALVAASLDSIRLIDNILLQ